MVHSLGMRLIRLYQKGVITEHELLNRLAEEPDQKLPKIWREKLNKLLAYRAANSDKVFRTFSIRA